MSVLVEFRIRTRGADSKPAETWSVEHVPRIGEDVVWEDGVTYIVANVTSTLRLSGRPRFFVTVLLDRGIGR